MLTDTQISQFRELYRKRFGREISRAEAARRGMQLVQMYRIIYAVPASSEKRIPVDIKKGGE